MIPDFETFTGPDGAGEFLLGPKQVHHAMKGEGVLLVDIREPEERLREGSIAGAVPVPRGVLEYRLHPDSPYYDPIFASAKQLIFVCAKDWRAHLAAKLSRELGYDGRVLTGAMEAWVAAGLPLVQPDGQKHYRLDEIEAMLPHILKRANIARYQDGEVLIGNRKAYPFQQEFVHCKTVEEVAIAIETMITQGVGPWVAAVHAMALRAEQMAGSKNLLAELEIAKARLVATRPTNTLIRYRLEDVLACAAQALASGNDPAQAILDRIEAIMDQMYRFYGRRGQFGAKLLEKGDGVLTMCFAETSFILTMAMAKDAGKTLTAYVPETRPYLQGARLTAPSLQEVGVDVKLITDNMPAALMATGKIHKYMTAADLITMDGHVVNKVGTFQNALAAHAHGIPYFAFAWGCDRSKPDRASIEIETRDPAEILQCRGVETTLQTLGASYPAFDITPPKYVAGIITRHGLLSPYALKNGFEE